MPPAAHARPLGNSRHPVAPAPARPAARDELAILYIGAANGTSLQRARALSEIGHSVVHIPSNIPRLWRLPYQIDPIYNAYRVVNRIRRAPDFHAANLRAIWAASRRSFDVVWVDKGLWISPSTLDQLRALQPRARFVSYSPDDMLNPANQSPRYLKSIGRYDLHITTKSYNVAELEELGAKEVLFVDNAFDPSIHRPVELSREDEARFAADAGFVGFFEEDRAELMYQLAAAGIRVTVRGPNWRLFGKSHPLLEVRKAYRDLQTTRSIEIPGCRAFMLAERTAEHRRLFTEGKEAEFFGSFEELLAKCRYYLAHDLERRKIAAAGYRRCHAGYTNAQRLSSMLEHVLRIPLPARVAPLRLAFAN
jgi:hypothetical protein